MRIAPLLVGLLASGCYLRHEPPGPGPRDAGASRFEGRWLVDQPFHALYEATIYDLLPDGRFVEVCSESFGGPTPTGTVTRDADGRTCEMVGPWSSIGDEVLAIEAFCDDSVRRTVVLDVVWDGEAPVSVTVQKVDGEETGWAHGPFEWRWLPCALAGDGCALCE